jgi:fumarylacetoacetate (FAA) hydrolase family protein
MILTCLPEDWRSAVLIGRVDGGAGPTPVMIRDGALFDMSGVAPTVAGLLDGTLPPRGGRALGPAEAALPAAGRLLSPIDLQVIKASGVTFAVSALERVIEERAAGDPARAADLRAAIEARVGAGLRAVRPGSAEAAALKAVLIGEGLWSPYLEVAIGPDAEIFTKGPVLSSVGPGAQVGVRSDSAWNNPEPEVVVVVDSAGRIVGATLGNDVNLRDIEGRSALLLGKAKDNNASCAIGPFIRLFDERFTIEDVRSAEVSLAVEGADGFRLTGRSSMREISRDPADLVAQALSEHHYPDGFVLFCGTMFAPTQDRGAPGHGFTHHRGDVVRITTPRLGVLENSVTTARDAPPWTVGVGALMRNLARRGLLDGAAG